jgi:hypothetical protein
MEILIIDLSHMFSAMDCVLIIKRNTNRKKILMRQREDGFFLEKG